MEGIIVAFRGSHHTQYETQMIIQSKGVDSKDKAAKLVGHKVSWSSPAGTEIKGEIKAAHGSNGAMRVIFERGMPGQALSSAVKIE